MIGLNKKKILKFAEKLKINYKFNKKKVTAGNDFYIRFMYRHPELILKIFQNINISRQEGFPEATIKMFCLYSKYKLGPS